MKNLKKEKLLKSNLELAKRIAGEGIVLLKNKDNILPLDPAEALAVFGRGCIDTKISGSGSGATESEDTINIIDGLLRYDYNIDKSLLNFYERKVSNNNNNSIKKIFSENTENEKDNDLPWWYEFWGKYNSPASEIDINNQLVKKASQKSETALVVISRVSGGEECDRRLEDDYYLSKKEKRLLKQVSKSFFNVIVLLNIAGVIDLSWVNEFPTVKGILNISLPGQIAGTAVAEVLKGKITPSGKLVDSYAGSYDDYPGAEHFSFNKEKPENIKIYQDYGLDPEENGSIDFVISPVTVYQESIYTGYRYFDTFGIDLIYPFGFGLSYTEFDINYLEGMVNIEQDLISLKIKVN
ncbi:MAG: glycoside hydrolase family 3 protein, partial [Bacillota bacterium]